MKVGIIGSGWNGCHMALELAKSGHETVLFETDSRIMSGVSGQFGIRLHRGPHYPRSKRTRESCQESFDRFCATYPELVVQHEESVYACGKRDADDSPSKVSALDFAEVCKESGEPEAIDLEKRGFKELECAYNINEPSVVVGERLRSFFERQLADAPRLRVLTSAEVKWVETCKKGQRKSKKICYAANAIQRLLYKAFTIQSVLSECEVDFVINATGFQALIPPSLLQNLPANLQIVYQVCLALRYKDTMPRILPISFIVMDGWFPCLMPLIHSTGDKEGSAEGDSSSNLSSRRPSRSEDVPRQRDYILTHGSYTIRGSFPTFQAATNFYENQLSDEHVSGTTVKATQADMERFWPGFTERFKYDGWHGAVLAKPRTQTELRTALVFEKDQEIYVFPGKISNVFSACDEVLQLMGGLSVQSDGGLMLDEKSGCHFVEGGALHLARDEIKRHPGRESRNTSNLRPHAA